MSKNAIKMQCMAIPLIIYKTQSLNTQNITKPQKSKKVRKPRYKMHELYDKEEKEGIEISYQRFDGVRSPKLRLEA